MRAIIGTWRMSAAGVAEAYAMLQNGADAGDAVVHAIKRVENDPAYNTVGYGGLPDRDGHVLTDAAYMDGQTLRYGGIISAEHIANPILAARLLCGREKDCLLAGRGAEQFATECGLERRDMRTEEAMRRWREGIGKNSVSSGDYYGHDTVCVLALDDKGGMVAGASTSGLFMKAPGRVGDTPVIGSGFYCDARYGAAAATGIGEDIMRGCLSYEIVSLMRQGEDPRVACERAVCALTSRQIELGEKAGRFSVIALTPDGRFGAATSLPIFPFAAGGKQSVLTYGACAQGGEARIIPDDEIVEDA